MRMVSLSRERSFSIGSESRSSPEQLCGLRQAVSSTCRGEGPIVWPLATCAAEPSVLTHPEGAHIAKLSCHRVRCCPRNTLFMGSERCAEGSAFGRSMVCNARKTTRRLRSRFKWCKPAASRVAGSPLGQLVVPADVVLCNGSEFQGIRGIGVGHASAPRTDRNLLCLVEL